LRCGFLSLLGEKTCLAKSDTFHGGWSILFFQKAKLEKFGSVLIFSTGGCQEHMVLL
jgi:hypothetical protein